MVDLEQKKKTTPDDLEISNEINKEINKEKVQMGTMTENTEIEVEGNGLTIGQYLKTEREKRQYSLKKISHRTKISITLLENLEEDRLSHLPNKAYVLGFVKSYAQVLGLNIDICSAKLDRLYGRTTNTIINAHEDVFNKSNHLAKVDLVKMLASTIGILLLIVGIVLGVRSASKNEAEMITEKVIYPQTINYKTPLKMEQNKLDEKSIAKNEVKKATDLSPTSESIVKQSNPGQELATPQNNQEKTQEKVVTGQTEQIKEKTDSKAKEDQIAQTTPVAPIKASSLFAFADKKSEEAASVYLPSNVKNSIVQGLQNVYVNAHDGDSWITYKTDNGPVKKFVLSQGRTLLIRGKEIRMFLGNIGATKVFLNNKLLDLKSTSGVKSLVFPLENASKYSLPLFVYDQQTGMAKASDEVTSAPERLPAGQ